MKLNNIELKYFVDYCLSNLNNVIKNSGKINLVYEDNKLKIKFENQDSFSTLMLECNRFEYSKIADRIINIIIYNQNISKTEITDNECTIITNNIEIFYDIVCKEQLENLKVYLNKPKSNLKYKEENTSIIHKLCRMYLRYCSFKDEKFSILVTYKNNELSLIISNNDTVLVYEKISCSEKQASILTKNICEQFTSDYSLISSKLIPITENQIQLDKLVSTDEDSHLYILESEQFKLIIPFNFKDIYYLESYQRTSQMTDPKILKLIFEQSISNR